SLVLLDELGRGTSTFDGMAIARAVLERLAQSQGPIVLFATHYHELTELAQVNPSITNLTVEVLTGKGRQLVFTHRVLEGVASQSYGIQVAQMAGLPQSVIARARHYLDEWESALPNRTTSVEQVTLFAPDPVAEELRRTIAMLDIDELSPRDAWQWIAEWHTRLTREEEQ
ncbi:MAG: MutS-related protein, partial [Sulfobacillus sp.]